MLKLLIYGCVELLLKMVSSILVVSRQGSLKQQSGFSSRPTHARIRWNLQRDFSLFTPRYNIAPSQEVPGNHSQHSIMDWPQEPVRMRRDVVNLQSVFAVSSQQSHSPARQ